MTGLRYGRLVALAVALGLASGQRAVAQSVRLDSLMSARDWKATGVGRLTAAERAALERWIARREAKLVAERTAAPRTDARVSTAPVAEYAAAPQVAIGSIVQVTTLLSGGGFVGLADGTLWEVWSSDLTGTRLWAAGDHVIVRSNPAPPAEWYTLRFEHGRTRTVASVRYAGTTGPSRVAIGAEPARQVAPYAPTVFMAPVYVPGYYEVPGYHQHGYYDRRWDRERVYDPRFDRNRDDRRPSRLMLEPRNVGVRPGPRPTPTAPPRMEAAPRMAPAPTVSPAPGLSPVPRP